MKKILALALALLMVVALCACGDKAEETTEEVAAAAPAVDAAPVDGEASGEPSGEPSGEMGDVSEPPASGTAENTAHGTASADEAGYKEYLHAWLDSEFEANSSMEESQKAEFEACIDAGTYDEHPATMFYANMLVTGSAMTYDEFIAAGGVY